MRGSPTRSTTLSQSQLEPEQAAAREPPKSPSPDILERFPFCWNRDPPPYCLRAAAPARAGTVEKTKAADGKGPIPHDGDLKSAETLHRSLLQQEVGEELQELEIISPARKDCRREARRSEGGRRPWYD